MLTPAASLTSDERLALLERRYARLTRLTVVLGVAALVAVTGAFAAPRGPRVDAQHVVLTDFEGRVSVDLSISHDGRLEMRFSGKPLSGHSVAQMVLVDE